MSEPIKRYAASAIDIAIEELANLYEGGSLMASTDPVAFLRTVASDVRELRSKGIESAKAEAFRMGQESMKKDAAVVAGKSPCAGHTAREDRYGCETCGYHDQIADLITELPLKDKP